MFTSTWMLARFAERCGNCAASIAPGEWMLERRIHRARRVRCFPCGESLLASPAVIEDQTPTEVAVPQGIRHQPSLGFEPTTPRSPGFVSAEELAERTRRQQLVRSGGR